MSKGGREGEGGVPAAVGGERELHVSVPIVATTMAWWSFSFCPSSLSVTIHFERYMPVMIPIFQTMALSFARIITSWPVSTPHSDHSPQLILRMRGSKQSVSTRLGVRFMIAVPSMAPIHGCVL
jgi:hypothetical protein